MTLLADYIFAAFLKTLAAQNTGAQIAAVPVVCLQTGCRNLRLVSP